jgi:hypothetical protein
VTWRRDPVAIIYARASDPSKQLKSVECQTKDLEVLATSMKLETVRTFRDDRQGRSKGGDLKRPGLQEMLRFLANHPEKGTVLIWDRTRLARPKFSGDARKIELEILHEHGWWIEFLSGPKLTGNRQTDNIIATVIYEQGGVDGKYVPDALKIGGAMQKLALDGVWLGGKIPYGYALDITGPNGTRHIKRGMGYTAHETETSKLVLGDADEVRVCKLIRDLYLDEGLGIRNVRHKLRDRGLKSPTGKNVWPYASVRKILTDPVYIGTYVWNASSKAEYCPITKEGPRAKEYALLGVKPGTLQANDKEDWVVKTNWHPAIVAPRDSKRILKRLTANNDSKGRNHGYLLSGCDSLLVCEVCGERSESGTPYTFSGRKDSWKVKDGKREKFIYRCTGPSRQAGIHGTFKVDCDVLDSAIHDKISEALQPIIDLNRDKLRSKLIEALESKTLIEPRADLAGLQRQADGLAAKIDQALENLGTVPASVAKTLGTRIQRWEKEHQDLVRQISESQETSSGDDVAALADEYLGMLDDLRGNIERAPLNKQKVFYKRAMERIALRFDESQPRGKRCVGGVIKASPGLVALAGLGSRAQTGDPVRERVEARQGRLLVSDEGSTE